MEAFFNILSFLLQLLFPFFAFFILYNCIIALRDRRRPKQPLITLTNMLNGDNIPILYWENSIGRSKSSDIILADPTVSRDHAVLFKREDGWIVKDTDSHSGTKVNDRKIRKPRILNIGDTLTFGGTKMMLREAETDVLESRSWFFKQNFTRRTPSAVVLIFLTAVFQLLGFTELVFRNALKPDFEYFIPFGLLTAVNIIFYTVSKNIFHRINFEIEIIALFLSGIGVMVISSTDKTSAYTQLVAMAVGITLYCFMLKFLQNPNTVMKWRMRIAIIAVGVLAVNLVLGTTANGSKNWIIIGPVSIQPSEFVKIALVMLGTSTLPHLQTTKNLTGFIMFSGICMGALFLMGDFGTACIFFMTFLIIAFMRSGNIRTIILIIAAAVFGVFIILRFKPYIAERFSSWGHAFEYVQTTGYQPANVLTYASSGGLFGFGLGKGRLCDIFASNSDLVFGMLCEEMGIIFAIIIALIIPSLAFYARALSERSQTTLYSIGACAVGGMFVFQTALNIFGATDILPLTGVTFPFVSAGGSSMIATWGLLSFIKVADERTYVKTVED